MRRLCLTVGLCAILAMPVFAQQGKDGAKDDTKLSGESSASNTEKTAAMRQRGGRCACTEKCVRAAGSAEADTVSGADPVSGVNGRQRRFHQ